MNFIMADERQMQSRAGEGFVAVASQARTRLGADVMRQLARRVLRPLAEPGAAGAWYRRWRVMALDGSCLDVADERANAEHFGYPASSTGQAAFPQARVLGLLECGTHAIVAAEVAAYAQGERTMAAALLPGNLRADMLLLAERGFYGFKLWQQAASTGAALLWRLSSTLKLPVHKALDDGSYLKRHLRQHGQVPGNTGKPCAHRIYSHPLMQFGVAAKSNKK